MAVKKPIVQYSGQLAELAAGDDLGVSSNAMEITAINGEAGAIVIGAPVYVSAAGTVKKAQATSAALEKCVGLVSDASIAAAATGGVLVNGLLAATTGQWDAVTGEVGGLTPGAQYFLDVTLGLLSQTAPSAAGQYVRRIGRAFSTTEMLVEISQSVLLS